MKTLSAALLCLLLCVPAVRGEDAAPAAASDTGLEPIAPESPKAADASSPAEAPKPAKAGPKTSAEDRLELEWRFLSAAVQDANGEAAAAALDELKTFVDAHPAAPMKADALLLLGTLRQKKGDVKGGLVDLLRLIYEFPDSSLAMKAKSAFLDGANRKLPGKLRSASSEIVRAPESGEKSERLAVLIDKLATTMEDALYEPSLDEVRRFQTRFSDFAQADKVQWGLAQLHERAAKWPQAILAYRKLLSVYPESALRPKAQLAVATILADDIKDYKLANEAFLELVEKFPDAPDVRAALQRASQLYSERLKQYELAAEIDEKLVKLFPKTDAALKALRDEAGLQRSRLNLPADAIKTDQRLAEMFPAAGVDALREAAIIARKDLTDYKQEVDIRRSISKSFPAAKEAAEELYNAASVAESDLKDSEQAILLYKELQTSFPSSKQARYAGERIAKLEKK